MTEEPTAERLGTSRCHTAFSIGMRQPLPASGNTAGSLEQAAKPRWALPASDDLIYVLGRIIYNFVQLDISAERLRQELAGHFCLKPPDLPWEQLVGELERAVSQAPAGEEFPAQVLRISIRYIDLRTRRDRLLGAPSRSTAANAWPLEDIRSTARDMEVAALEINRLLRQFF